MEANASPHLTIVLLVNRAGTAFRPYARAPHLPILLSPEVREAPRGRSRQWPPRWVQALMVAVLGTLLGIGIPMLMQVFGY